MTSDQSHADTGPEGKQPTRTITLGADDARMIAGLLKGPEREPTPSMRKAIANYKRLVEKR